MTPEQREKLPRYAQDAIRLLEQKIVDMDRQIRDANTVVDRECQEGVIVSPYSDRPVQYPTTSHFRFWLVKDAVAIDAHITRDFSNQPSLYLSAYCIRRSGCMQVQPSASNAIHLGVSQ